MSYFCNDLGWIDVVSNDFGIFQGDNITIYYRVFFFFYVGRSARRLPFYNGRSILLWPYAMYQCLTFPKEICFGEINKQSPIIWVDGVFKLPLIYFFIFILAPNLLSFFKKKIFYFRVECFLVFFFPPFQYYYSLESI